jgi:anti-sigma regulatory factor (Ser/Thr protein kinase)
MPQKGILTEAVVAAVEEARLRFRGVPGLDIQLAVSASAKYLETVFDSASLMRVLANLINNAVESSEASEKVTVVRISLDQSEEWLECTVEDRGRGIPAEILPRLMERGATFGKAKGSGLGLYHARQTVLSWFGRLEIQSEVGTGTKVTLLLPFAQDGLPAGDLVLVDDDVWVREAWEQAAAKAGRKIRTFATAGALYEILEAIAKDATIYIDFELDGKECGSDSGEDVAAFLHSQGFFNLFLASGYDASVIARRELFKGIVGKNPPFNP